MSLVLLSGCLSRKSTLNFPVSESGWQGWHLDGREIGEFDAEAETARRAALPPEHVYPSVRVESQAELISISFPVESLRFYRIEFTAKSEGQAMLQLRYQDTAGKQLADHSTGIEVSPEFTRHVMYSRSKLGAAQARVVFLANGGSVDLASIQVFPADSNEVARWADAIASTVPEVPEALFSQERWNRIEDFRDSLSEARRLRVVLLGDSIMNDSGNSPFDVLVERHYPGLNFEVITSVEGGRGAWFYRQANRIESYVIEQEPDLVMIGGISHKNDIDAVAAIVDQIRTQLEVPIVLMTGALGYEGDPRRWDPPAEGAVPPATGWARKLRHLAEEKETGFFDLEQAWGAVLMAGDAPYEYYLRDVIHANTRGQQVLARIFERYFAPE